MHRPAHEPYLPLNTPKPIAENLWVVDGPEITMSMAGFSMPFPTRMTIVRLANGALWLHSPTMPDDALVSRVKALGDPRWLIAPNTIHYWWMPEWKALFPDAPLYAVPGLADSAKRPVTVDHDLTDEAAPWSDHIRQVVVAGSIITEAVFFHCSSRTLILTDLIENFEPERVHGMLLRTLIQLGGVAAPNGRTPIDMQFTYWRQRETVRKAVETMISWAPQRILFAHGKWFEGDGAKELRRAFSWVL